MLIVNWIFDHIPLWVWVTVTICGAGAAFYFFSPILVPLWNITPRWVKVVLGFILSILAALAAGRYKGAKDERDMQARRNAQAIQTRTEVDNEVGNLSNADADKRLDQWMRDSK